MVLALTRNCRNGTRIVHRAPRATARYATLDRLIGLRIEGEK
jgi:hypothetical protein